MSANIPSAGDVRQLDVIPEPPAPITEKEVAEPKRLSRLLIELTRTVAQLAGRWAPSRVDFEGRTFDATGTTKYRFQHGFGVTKVRYWLVEWSGAAAPNIVRDATSDSNTLVVTSTSAGTGTLRVEQAG